MTDETKYDAYLPKCDFCERTARYDACCADGSGWAYMCKDHYAKLGLRVKGLHTDLVAAYEKRKKRLEG